MTSAQTDRPIGVALLLDNSSELEPRRSAHRQAHLDFTRALRAGDLVEVVEFSNPVVVRHKFTSNAAELEHTIVKSPPPSGSALYDAILKGIRDLDKLRSQPEWDARPLVLVVFSGGHDFSSRISAPQLLAIARNRAAL